MLADLATRQDTSGDKFVMVIEGQEIRDRGIAGELLLRRAERMLGTRSDRQAGAIGGFGVFASDNFTQGPEIVLKAAATYTAKVTDTALGTIRSVEHTIQHLEELAGNSRCTGIAITFTSSPCSPPSPIGPLPLSPAPTPPVADPPQNVTDRVTDLFSTNP